nr:hypothetical protein [Delftia sp.]
MSGAFCCRWPLESPDWPALDIAHLEHLPGVRWKVQNLAQLRTSHPRKFAEQADLLAARLAI